MVDFHGASETRTAWAAAGISSSVLNSRYEPMVTPTLTASVAPQAPSLDEIKQHEQQQRHAENESDPGVERDGDGGHGHHRRGVAEIAPVDRRRAAGFHRRARPACAPKAISSPSTSFGIMPAPGEASVPNGRSPLSAKTSSASDDEHAAGDMIPANDHDADRNALRPGVRSSSHLADCVNGGLDALGVLVPELGEFGLVEIGDVVADILDRLLELRRWRRPS